MIPDWLIKLILKDKIHHNRELYVEHNGRMILLDDVIEIERAYISQIEYDEMVFAEIYVNVNKKEFCDLT